MAAVARPEGGWARTTPLKSSTSMTSMWPGQKRVCVIVLVCEHVC